MIIYISIYREFSYATIDLFTQVLVCNIIIPWRANPGSSVAAFVNGLHRWKKKWTAEWAERRSKQTDDWANNWQVYWNNTSRERQPARSIYLFGFMLSKAELFSWRWSSRKPDLSQDAWGGEEREGKQQSERRKEKLLSVCSELDTLRHTDLWLQHVGLYQRDYAHIKVPDMSEYIAACVWHAKYKVGKKVKG